MKCFQWLVIAMLVAVKGFSQASCDQFLVQQIQMDTAQQNWEVTIFLDADPSVFINYPYIALMINEAGDTVAQGSLEYFGQFGQTSNVFHPAIALADDAFVGDIYFVYDQDTCIFNTTGLGVTALSFPQEIAVYPNPSVHVVSWNIPANDVLDLIIWDAQGRCVHHDQRHSQVNVEDWTRGLYMYRMQTKKGWTTDSFMVAE